MSGIGPSIGGNDRSGQDRAHDPLYLAQIEKNKNSGNGGETISNPKSKIFALTAATIYLKKFVDHFINAAATQSSSVNTEKTLQDLALFKKILEELEVTDNSHNPEYTQRLSQLWQNLYENYGGIEQKLSLDPLAAKVLSIVKEINNFPEGEEFTLGYYLNEHAGQDWIPFPFMNMLMALHEEHLASPETSQLHNWIQQMKDSLGNFDLNS